MFVVLFVYVFGGSVSVPGYASYKQFVIPGIFAQTVLFGSIYTGLGIAEDLSKGFVERLRSLPMYPSAVLYGRTISDVVRNAVSFVVMLVVAFLVGFRIEGSIGRSGRGDAVVVRVRATRSAGSRRTPASRWARPRRSNSASFIWMFPLTFISSAFVDAGEHAELAASRSPSTTRSPT